MVNNISILVIGGLHTDIVALGTKKLLHPGELTFAEKLYIDPGGKSRNIAHMIATLSNKKNVAMISKTSRDPYGLWKIPVDSLEQAGVNTDYVRIISFEKSKQFPGIALIPVDKEGKNQIYVIPGIAKEFSPSDIDNADILFKKAEKNGGMFVSTFELPYKTLLHAVKKAKEHNLKILLDPGGMQENQNNEELLAQRIFLIKPNEHEAEMLTGIKVTNYESARNAANLLLKQRVENVLITCGVQGAYFFNNSVQLHIPIPDIQLSDEKDETGCGDQSMAALAEAISEKKVMQEAAKLAILAGTIQFYNHGIKPITKKQLNKYL